MFLLAAQESIVLSNMSPRHSFSARTGRPATRCCLPRPLAGTPLLGAVADGAADAWRRAATGRQASVDRGPTQPQSGSWRCAAPPAPPPPPRRRRAPGAHSLGLRHAVLRALGAPRGDRQAHLAAHFDSLGLHSGAEICQEALGLLRFCVNAQHSVHIAEFWPALEAVVAARCAAFAPAQALTRQFALADRLSRRLELLCGEDPAAPVAHLRSPRQRRAALAAAGRPCLALLRSLHLPQMEALTYAAGLSLAECQQLEAFLTANGGLWQRYVGRAEAEYARAIALCGRSDRILAVELSDLAQQAEDHAALLRRSAHEDPHNVRLAGLSLADFVARRQRLCRALYVYREPDAPLDGSGHSDGPRRSVPFRTWRARQQEHLLGSEAPRLLRWMQAADDDMAAYAFAKDWTQAKLQQEFYPATLSALSERLWEPDFQRLFAAQAWFADHCIRQQVERGPLRGLCARALGVDPSRLRLQASYTPVPSDAAALSLVLKLGATTLAVQVDG